ncbi:MAG TPA: substrate-binding domain-containing protein [Tepidisphaeraceae bacterium]|nr:substrate-binding domain-containing protein [Tepidisphaeraceae bacterium]
MTQIVRRLLAGGLVAILLVILVCGAIFLRAEQRIAAAQQSPAPGDIKKIAPIPLPPLPPPAIRTVRVAVIGGMVETGFWQAITAHFTQQTGIKVDLVAAGPVNGIAPVFKYGGIDLITMHACDTIINLVADGYAIDAKPWAKNDLIIVGPPDDPAHIKGMTDAASALRKIVASKSHFIVHSSVGAREVLQDIIEPADISLDLKTTTVLLDDKQRHVLYSAATDHAYTLIGRIPFLDHKFPNNGMALMVQGDPRLRRPFVVAVANPARMKDVHLAEARKLEEFLLSPQNQEWIGQFDKGKYDDQPLFFPIWPRE